MTVQAIYYSDRDGLDMALKNPEELLFNSKADADARDKILELSDEIRVWLLKKVDGLGDDMAEKCALAIAEDKALFQQAFKKPQALNEPEASE